MKTNKTLLITLIAIIAIFIGLVIFVPKLTGKESKSEPIDISTIDISSVIEPSEANGNIGDHIKGNVDAPVTIFEYADYQCSACANMNIWMQELFSEYDGKFRIVYRNFPITSLHPNAIAAASAVEAAGLQGYWEAYGDLLFANQAEWFYATGTSRTNLFMSYFTSVSGGQGDLPKFRSDMASAEVKKKVEFDQAISKSLNLTGTPSFYDSEGNEIEWIKHEDQTKSETLDLFRAFLDSELEKASAK